MKTKIIHSAIFGLVVGDALGVPVEFQSRSHLQKYPVLEMTGYGTHNQPVGTWSDDSSLSLCLAESLCGGYDLKDISNKFLKWYKEEIWVPHGHVFDIGIATTSAMMRIAKGTDPVLCGGNSEMDNGNGSLMRILPMVFYLRNETDLEIIFDKVKAVSSITHAHFRSVFACFIYVVYALEVLKGNTKKKAYFNMQSNVKLFIAKNSFNKTEIQLFDRILMHDISKLATDEIFSSGYVVHSLEASLWSLLNSNTYAEAVLKAVNLGEDTDTTGAITGGIAGLVYGYESIPKNWMDVIVTKNEIENLCNLMTQKFYPDHHYNIKNIAERSNNEFIFFCSHAPTKDGSISKSCLSQWWPSSFVADDVTYKTAEHWMMAKKAALFNDFEIVDKILKADNPADAKKLGRAVKNYNDTVWTENRFEIVKNGNHLKFSQNDELKAFLLSTNDMVLVEASASDLLWGMGLAENDVDAMYPEKWKGLNLLGFALMEVRDDLKK
ncbi:ADP-ribosylglycohydrolase family protein [Pedobacter changchengzhani]|uniref:ADP-ribosylglycohydrolase family protein n=1 Tax=Pedobacter changchengzhani TaxID=2529274 RepID=UPI001FB5D632|nr:ADP-ribosylglycohydrolase family protein [Pedobacter changchengzhani]